MCGSGDLELDDFATARGQAIGVVLEYEIALRILELLASPDCGALSFESRAFSPIK